MATWGSSFGCAAGLSLAFFGVFGIMAATTDLDCTPSREAALTNRNGISATATMVGSVALVILIVTMIASCALPGAKIVGSVIEGRGRVVKAAAAFWLGAGILIQALCLAAFVSWMSDPGCKVIPILRSDRYITYMYQIILEP